MDAHATGHAARKERESVKLPLRQVAERMMISAPYLSDMELGRRCFNAPMAARFNAAIAKEAQK